MDGQISLRERLPKKAGAHSQKKSLILIELRVGVKALQAKLSTTYTSNKGKWLADLRSLRIAP